MRRPSSNLKTSRHVYLQLRKMMGSNNKKRAKEII
uniref:Uncharacterized protein n=1 Tax=Arundo donax TaxID=35708 RepID=A0A0A9GF18_ARUDO